METPGGWRGDKSPGHIILQRGTESRFGDGMRGANLVTFPIYRPQTRPLPPQTCWSFCPPETGTFLSQGRWLALPWSWVVAVLQAPGPLKSAPVSSYIKSACRPLAIAPLFHWHGKGPWRPWPVLGPTWGRLIGSDHSSLSEPPHITSMLFASDLWRFITFKYTGGSFRKRCDQLSEI